jgi:hypothetical protein
MTVSGPFRTFSGITSQSPLNHPFPFSPQRPVLRELPPAMRKQPTHKQNPIPSTPSRERGGVHERPFLGGWGSYRGRDASSRGTGVVPGSPRACVCEGSWSLKAVV